ncbi:MAG: 2,3-bisphosphoglycerate-independent phosphoglycerate mutase [Candidatus Pacebacteria bacterium]|nr:2,3-bisphosphoglycerate-independent phosphoglycerate mutase [Candidatus Paceibacterota bacterium]
MIKNILENKKQNILLIIIDGLGLSDKKEGNAFTLAKTPYLDYAWKNYPHTKLLCHGKYAGLPNNQDGNSEAGHMNLGAGRVVLQDAIFISNSIKDGTFFKNEAFRQAIYHLKKHKSKFHLMGLLSGKESPHVYPDHLYGLFELAKREKIKPILHLFTDGRDSSPHGSIEFLRHLKKNFKNGEVVASIVGRFYAMDRKKNWSNIEKVYNLLTLGKGVEVESAEDAIVKSYNQGLTDEFIMPSVIMKDGKPTATIDENDIVIFFNLRSDRARELTKPFTQEDFNTLNPGAFKRKKIPKNIRFVAMTDFGPELSKILTAFPSRDVVNSLPFALCEREGICDGKQLYIAESEKYAHVTFFFNGGWSVPVVGEETIRVPSPDVDCYDKTPEMSAVKLTKILKEKIKKGNYNFICVNYANPDMIAHTGDLKAGIKCLEVLDKLIKSLINEALKNNFICVVTSDHGNIEEMLNTETREVDTKHSKNKTPFILISKEKKYKNIRLKEGVLGDVAPTILEIMGIKKPKEMTRKGLIMKKSKIKLWKNQK